MTVEEVSRMFALAKLNHLEKMKQRYEQSGTRNKIPGFVLQRRDDHFNVKQKLNPD